MVRRRIISAAGRVVRVAARLVVLLAVVLLVLVVVVLSALVVGSGVVGTTAGAARVGPPASITSTSEMPVTCQSNMKILMTKTDRTKTLAPMWTQKGYCQSAVGYPLNGGPRQNALSFP